MSATTDSKTLQPHENVNDGSDNGTMPWHRPTQAFKVYSFRRWSSRLQNDGDSDRRQLEAALEYCSEKGWTLDEQLVAPGRSAYHQKNGGPLATFFRLIEDRTVRPGDVLIVEGFDRFSRQPPDLALPQFLRIIHAGVAIHTTLDKQEFTKASVRKNQNQLYGTISAMWGAYLESHNKGDRVRKAWRKRREAPTLVCPTWLRPLAKQDENGLLFELIEERGKVIERIFNLALEGHGVEMVCRILNRSHTLGFARHGTKDDTDGKRKRGAENGWHHSYVRTLLTDRRVIGEATFNEWRSDDDGPVRRVKTGITRKIYPAAVSNELWQQVQDCRRRDRLGGNGANMSNLLTGIAKCSCGASMTLVRKGTLSTYTYLQCSDARRGMGCEAKKLHRYELVEMFTLALCGTLAFGDVQLDDTGSALRAKRDAAQRQADDLETQFNNLADAIGQQRGALTAKRLSALETSHAAKLAEVAAFDRQLAKMEARPIAERLTDVRKLVETMDGLNGDERIAVRSRINRGLSEFIGNIMFNDAKPPTPVITWAEHVTGHDWYLRFSDAFPIRLLKGAGIEGVMLAMAMQQGVKPVRHGDYVRIEADIKVR